MASAAAAAHFSAAFGEALAKLAALSPALCTGKEDAALGQVGRTHRSD